MQGLQLMLNSEKGQHLDMPILDYHQVCTHAPRRRECDTLSRCCPTHGMIQNVCGFAATCNLQSACFMIGVSPWAFTGSASRWASRLLLIALQVSALALEPISSGTWLVLDGEKVPYTRLYGFYGWMEKRCMLACARCWWRRDTCSAMHIAAPAHSS
jgi:hypothetical protein